MYESDGSIMVYWHALDTPETPTGKLAYKHYTFLTQILTCLNYLHGNFEMIDYIMRYNNIWNSVIRFNRNYFRVL